MLSYYSNTCNFIGKRRRFIPQTRKHVHASYNMHNENRKRNNDSETLVFVVVVRVVINSRFHGNRDGRPSITHPYGHYAYTRMYKHNPANSDVREVRLACPAHFDEIRYVFVPLTLK